ncbi:hypothetical protein SBA5_200040 [Candidatus Sulfotelmatomonas gaucii]|uniref:Uncharacterized protein n=1 Tax=Candidatus Sulfuritelmatomonas gaucii TaxID=2043161 RepID=A0A2N9L751_9BACT|nr:hypothetical protein SBA5_200040 [Candidatus Sulfotelmatomonas gaucii]
MTWWAIVAVERMVAHELEERPILLLDRLHNFKLPGGREYGKLTAIKFPAQGIGSLQAVAVGAAMVAKMAHELPIDEIDDAGLGGAWKVIGRNDLIADRL